MNNLKFKKSRSVIVEDNKTDDIYRNLGYAPKIM